MKSPYVALRELRFGDVLLAPGDAVPVEAGRNYDRMLKLGQIGPAAPEHHQDEDDRVFVVVRNSPATFVSIAGDVGDVTFLDFVDVQDTEAREALGLNEGEQATLVEEVSGDPFLVHADQLLSSRMGQMLRDLIAKRVKEAREAADKTLAKVRAELESMSARAQEAETQLAALREAGAGTPDALQDPAPSVPLPHNFVAKGALAKVGITTYEELNGKTPEFFDGIEGIDAEKAARIVAARDERLAKLASGG